MTASYLGSYSIGAALPGATVVASAGALGIGAALPRLQGDLAGLQLVVPTPIDIGAQLAQLETMIAALSTQLALGIPPPSIALQVAGIEALIAALSGTVDLMTEQLALVAGFQSLLAAAGVHLIASEGPAANFGAEVGALVATLPGVGLSTVRALTLLTTDPATWSAMASIFRVTA